MYQRFRIFVSISFYPWLSVEKCFSFILYFVNVLFVAEGELNMSRGAQLRPHTCLLSHNEGIRNGPRGKGP